MYEITAVIPTYNRGSLIKRAILSVLEQSCPPAEIIVVDDGSSDDTGAVVATFGEQVKYVRQANAGAAAARNHGIALARHSWIAFLDSDDYWNPWHLERLTAAMRATQGEAFVYFADMQLPASEGGGTLWEHAGFNPKDPFRLLPDATAWVLMKRQPMMLQTSVIRKTALEAVGCLDVRFRLIHDSYLFCRLGISRPACAVAGIGCVQTSDDSTNVRLTVEIPLTSTGKAVEDCEMWSDILRHRNALPPEFIRLVRFNTAGCYCHVGRRLIRAGKYRRGWSTFLRGLAIDPRFAAWLLRHGTGNGYERTVRPAFTEYPA